jgi:predicted amidohydrolase YtcJ
LSSQGFQKFWFPNETARATVLDTVVNDRPAVFLSFDAHSAWANTRAMTLLNITKETPNPPGGAISRDENGNPIGHFDESAVKFFDKYVGLGIWDDNKDTITLDKKLQALQIAIDKMVSCGITAFQDAVVRQGNFEAYEAAARQEKLPIKASLCLWWDCNSDATQIDWMNDARERCKQFKNLRVSSVKFMLDGVMETKTAHLHSPYCHFHGPNPKGLALFRIEQLKEYFSLVDKYGFQIHCHAVGDAACSNALTAFQHVNEMNGVTSCRTHRHEIAHLQLVQPKDLSLFAQLSVAANFQPYWSQPDVDMIEITEPLLGPERRDWQYPIKTLLHNGTVVGFGSDWFVSPLEPLYGIQIAVTHQTLDGKSPVWNAKERLTLLEALHCYTRGSAYLNFLDNETGTLEVGKKADIVILNENLFAVEPHHIHNVLVVFTFVNGRVVYRRRQ